MSISLQKCPCKYQFPKPKHVVTCTSNKSLELNHETTWTLFSRHLKILITMVGTTSFVKKLGISVMKVSESKSSSWWYSHHMRAASRAILERIPLVDIVLEVRDARVSSMIPSLFFNGYQLFDEMSQSTNYLGSLSFFLF